MQHFFSIIKQAVRKNIVVLGLVSLLSLSGLFVFSNQSALALPNRPLNPPSQSDEVIDRAYSLSEATGLKEEDRQAAYDEAAEAITDPKGLDKIYEEDLKAYKEEQPDKGLIETAKDLIEDVTGKD